MKKILFALAALCLAAGCNKSDIDHNTRDALFIDNEHVSTEGSFVQGAAINEYAQVIVPYRNSQGGNATVSAPESNGMYISQQTIALVDGDGEFRVHVSGTPVELRNTFLQLNIAYGGRTYISSVEIPVMMDLDPDGTIVFQISSDDIVSLTEVTEIPFTVEPTMASVVISSDNIPGLAIKVTQDMAAGTGRVVITPSAQFLSGTITVTATFGARPTVSVPINVNGFDSGDGTAAQPYTITKPVQFQKLSSGLDKNYILGDNLTLGTVSPSAGTFTGSLNGDGKTIDFTVNTPAGDNAALFTALGSGASISGLTLTGSVTGQDNVAALAAANAGATVTSVDASGVTITGRNNIAVLSATGTGADASVLKFTATPTSVNILQGTPSAVVSLGITPVGANVTVDLESTGLQSYAYSAGQLTLTMPSNPADFVAGDITLSVKLAASGPGSNVNATPRTIAVKSQKMYESGTGVLGDPYMVKDQDQLAGTMTTYGSAYIALLNDIATTNWQTIPAFGGNLDGAGYKVSGLTSTFVGTLSGTVNQVKFTDVDIATAAAFGMVARTLNGSGAISKVAVTGRIISTNTGDIVGGIAGEAANASSITDCYVNLTIEAAGGMVGGIVGRLISGSTDVKITNCTTEGSIRSTSTSAGRTRFGGILGRGEGAGFIKNCLSSMTISAASTGSNGFGGIFGANNNDNLYIEECMFNGSISSGQDVGGIAGVGPRIRNCMVINATVANTAAGSNGNVGGICGTGKIYTDKCVVVSTTINGVTGSSMRSAAGIASFYQNNGYTSNSLVVSTAITASTPNRISGPQVSTSVLTNNYVSGNVVIKNSTDTLIPNVDPSGQDGGDAVSPLTQSWVETTLGFDFATVWEWDSVNAIPVLRNVGCPASVIP